MFKFVRTGSVTQPATPARRRTRKQKEDHDAIMVTWVTMALCALVSILFNVRGTAMHTHEPLGLGSAMIWPAVAVLGVHVAARGKWGGGLWWGFARYGLMGLGAVMSMVISMQHTREVLMMYGADGPTAVAGPLVLDTVMVVCGLSLINARKGDRRPATTGKPASKARTRKPARAPKRQLAAA
jgi:hypothetical protein